MERNSRCSSSVRMRKPTPLFTLGLWRSKAIMAASEQRAFCVLQFVKHESFVSVQRAFKFQIRSAFAKEKVQDGRVCQKKAWNEWDSHFYTVRRNLCAVGVVNWRCRVWLCGGCCERDCNKWRRFTCCSFWNRQTTSTEVTFALRCKMQWRRKGFLIVLCLVMNLHFISVGKCPDIMCVYGVLKILTRCCNKKDFPRDQCFLLNVHAKAFGAFLFPWRHCDGNKLSGNATDMALP